MEMVSYRRAGKLIVMNQLQRFAALPSGERRLLARAGLAVAAVRVALWLLPFRWLCERASAAPAALRRPGELPARKLAWAVDVVARRIPGASCLTQALALQWLLVRQGERSRIHVGVSRSDPRGLHSHAWVEVGGEVLIGGEGLEGLMPIYALPREGA
jgi:hypothetical protein